MVGALEYPLIRSMARKDWEQTKALNKLLSRYYRNCGIVATIAGVIFIPFVPMLFSKEQQISNLMPIYFIFLIGMVIGYLFRGKIFMLYADQRSYIVTSIQAVQNIVSSIAKVVVLVLTASPLLYILTSSIIGLTFHIFLFFVARRIYRFIDSHEDVEIEPEFKDRIKKNAFAGVLNSVSATLINGTDSFFIMWFANLSTVGLLSNYTMVITQVNVLIASVTNSIATNIGHLVNTESKQKQFEIFKNFFFLSFCGILIMSVGIFSCINDFLRVWIGQQYILPGVFIVIIITQNVFGGLAGVIYPFATGAGRQWELKWIGIIYGITNVAISLLLLIVFKMGLLGVLLANLISFVIGNAFIGPRRAFNLVFNMSYKVYLRLIMKYFTIVMFASGAAYILCQFVDLFIIDLLLILIIHIIIALLVSFCVIVCFKNTAEFKYIASIVKKTLKWGSNKIRFRNTL
ncbi:hypothetical protein FACS1894125_3410 [Actinomycetota bacterium]|nr:hypothetical protein FACS1894125_3410 [Actinomycetota bacterium]